MIKISSKKRKYKPKKILRKVRRQQRRHARSCK